MKIHFGKHFGDLFGNIFVLLLFWDLLLSCFLNLSSAVFFIPKAAPDLILNAFGYPIEDLVEQRRKSENCAPVWTRA